METNRMNENEDGERAVGRGRRRRGGRASGRERGQEGCIV